jgi:hypothetical protein
MLHDLGASVVEDEQVLVGLDEEDGLAGHLPGDVEPGLPHLDDAVAGDSGLADPAPTDRSLRVPWSGRIGFRCRFPCLLRGDPAGQPLVGSLGVIDLVEPVDLLLQLLDGAREGLLVEVSEEGLVEPFVLALRGRLIRFPGDRLNSEGLDIGDELPDDPAARRVQRGPV